MAINGVSVNNANEEHINYDNLENRIASAEYSQATNVLTFRDEEGTQKFNVEIEQDMLELDDTLSKTGFAADAKAVGDEITRVESAIPNVDSTLSTNGDAADAGATGAAITNAMSHVVNNLLGDAIDAHLEGNPIGSDMVQDGAITYAKLNSNINSGFVLDNGTYKYDYNGLVNKPFVTPEMYGAKGDGLTDDTQSINDALSSGLYVLFGNGKTYKVSGGLYIQEGQTIDLNGSTIVSSAASMFMNFRSSDVTYGYDGIGNFEIKNGTIYGGEMLFAHGENIRVRDVNFRNSLGSHCMQVMSCKRMVIDNCSFIGVTPNSNNGLAEPINLDPCDWEGFRGYGEGSLSYDGTNNYDITIQNCYFASGTDTGFVGLTSAIGGHYHVSADLYHDNVKFINNFVDGATYSGLRMLDFHNSIISGNKIVSSGYAFVFGYGDKNCVYNNDLVFTGASADSTTRAEMLSASETGLSLYGNTYRRYGSRHWYFNGNDVTFIKTDPIVIAYGTFGDSTDIPLDVPYYSFDTIYVTVGYTSGNTLKTASVKCWMGDLAPDGTCPAFKKLDSGNTRVYPIDGLADGATVTFDGDDHKKIVVSGASYATRFVVGSRNV